VSSLKQFIRRSADNSLVKRRPHDTSLFDPGYITTPWGIRLQKKDIGLFDDKIFLAEL